MDLCSRLTLEEKAMLMLDESPAIPRLGIKKFFWWSEALHGAANMGNVTNFPEPVGMAAAFNPDLLYKVFDVASTEFPLIPLKEVFEYDIDTTPGQIITVSRQ